MRREIITAASVLALMTGAAIAQTSSPSADTSGTAPQAQTTQNAPAADNQGATNKSASPGMGSAATGGPTATNMNQTGETTSLTGGQLVSAEEMLGKNVYGKDNEKIGEVEDVILDSSGKAKQLVISSGGFLGIGEKQIAVEYSEAQWNQAEERIQLSNMSRDQVKEMPDFQYSDTTTSLNRNKDAAGRTDAPPKKD